MKLLWSSILLKVNNRLDLITTTLVGKVWNDIYHDKKYFHICHYEEDIINKIDIKLKERSNQLRKKQMNYVSNNANTSTSTSFTYPQTVCTGINNYNIKPTNTDVNNYNNIKPTNFDTNYYITPTNSPQFSYQTIYSINSINNQINNEVISIPLSPISQCSVISINESYHSTESLNNYNLYNVIY